MENLTLYTLPEQQIDHAQNIQNAMALLGKGSKSALEMRTLILGLEAAMKAMPGSLTAEDFKTTHHFEDGVYMRELFIPKGTILTGKIHSNAHYNMLSQGKLTVWTEDGMKTLTASTVIRSLPGIKRVGYAHEDSIWITVHHNPSDERDIKKVEERLFSDTFDEAYLKSKRTLEDAILFLGCTREEMNATSENESDQIRIDLSGAQLGDSVIHGTGLFSTKLFKRGGLIGPARTGNKRTQIGRYCNHSACPNAEMLMRENGDVDLVAIIDIAPGEEIFNDYYLSYTKTRSVFLDHRKVG